MRNIIKKCLIFWAFNLCCATYHGCKAQYLTTTANIADSLFLSGQFEQSINLFKRVLFFDHNEVFDSLAFARLSSSYFALSKYEEAARYLGYSFTITNDYNFLFDQILCQILDGKFKIAKLTLLNISNQDPNVMAKKTGLLSLVEFRLNNFMSSEEYFKRFQKLDSTIVVNNETFSIVHQANKIRKKYKKSKVKLMSLIIPGLGQMYCGDFKEGLNSLGVTALFGGVYFRVANTLGILDAFITVLPWYQKYYVGGFNKAGKIAEDKQQQLLNQTFNEMIYMIEKSSCFSQ